MPTFIGGGGGGGGKVLQVVTATAAKVSTTATIPADDTIPQNTEGGELVTLAITPVSATSTLHIQFDSHVRRSASGVAILALFVDSTADAMAATAGTNSGTNHGEIMSFTHAVASASTSARTYKIRFGPATAATLYNYLNVGDDLGGVLLSRITIMEVES